MTRRQSELENLRKELQFYRFFVRDPELKKEVQRWIQDSSDKDAGSFEEFARQKVMHLRSEYPMLWAPDLPQGSEGFPDKCAECKHYGNRCPIVTDRERRRARTRKLSDARTEAEARHVWEQEAAQTGCKLVPKWINEWGTEYRGFIADGHELLDRCEELTQSYTREERATAREVRTEDLGGVLNE